MGYWVGSTIKQVPIEPGRVPGVAGGENAPEFSYSWHYLFSICNYSGILLSGSARGLVNTLLDTTFNVVSFSLCLLL